MKIIFISLAFFATYYSLDAQGAEPIVERYVYINRVSLEPTPYQSTGQGVIAGILIQNSQDNYNKALLKRYDFMKRSVPNFNIPEFIAEATRCMPIAGVLQKCIDAIVRDGEGVREQVSAHNPGDVIQVITISLDYNKLLAMKGGMLFHLTFDEMTFGSTPNPSHKYLQFIYWDPPPNKAMGSPFDAATEAHISEGELAAQRYWLEGNPSRFEVSVRRALADFRGITEIYYPYAAGQDIDPSKTDWWKSLSIRVDLKKQGVVPCLWRECKRPYVRVDGDRLWSIPESIPPRAVFESVPLSLWKQN